MRLKKRKLHCGVDRDPLEVAATRLWRTAIDRGLKTGNALISLRS